MSEHWFVDETKGGGYVLVASVHVSSDITAARKWARSLTLPGQTRIHMSKESDRRRRQIASEICAAGVTAIVYDVGRYSDELLARRAALELLTGQVRASTPTVLTLEQDDSLVKWDRRTLYDLSRQHNLGERFTYRHEVARSEPLLGIPDAVAWCWAKGGDWRRRVAPVVTDVRRP